MGHYVVDTAQSCLQELLSIGDDVRTTKVNRVTQDVQEPEPALNNAVIIHCTDHRSYVVVNCINIPASATYGVFITVTHALSSCVKCQRFSSATNEENQ